MTQMPEYDFNWDDAAAKTAGRSNPDGLNAIAASALSATSSEAPRIQPPSDCFVSLPGGLLLEDGSVLKTAEVRELTGEDEETLAKAKGNVSRWVAALLRAGVVSVGDQPATPALLKSLSIGDRETLLLGIRRATFGDSIEYKQFTCPFCDTELDLEVSLSSIPLKALDDPTKATYEVPLRKGGKAIVRLPNGSDQEAVLDDEDLSGAEQNTILLSRVIDRLVDAGGTEQKVAGRASVAKKIGMADRKTILAWCSDIQPGPQYDDVSFVHEACDKEVPVFVSMGDLFQGL